VSRTIVIGVGNCFRGDDAAGREVARRVRERVPGELEVVVCELEPTRLIDAWDGADEAFVVDAVASGAEPGTVHRFDATAEALPSREFRSSTHALGIGETIELSRAIGKLPARIIVFGIEGETFGSGTGLSGAAEEGVERAVEQVLEEAGCTSAR
jgi:hydrogenase maturation protease